MKKITIVCLALFLLVSWKQDAGIVRQKEHLIAADKSKKKKKIVIIAGGCTHGPMVHEYRAGSTLLAAALEQSMPGKFETIIYDKGWPADATAFDGVDAVVMYLDGGGGHPVLPHLEKMEQLSKKGVGIACLHFAVEIPGEKAGQYFLDWIGGYFETYWSVNPYWKAEFTVLPKHPVTNGVNPFSASDEWYYNMRFRENREGITPVLTAVPPASTLERPDGPHSNNPYVRANAGKAYDLAWVTENKNRGRGFGFTGGHSHRNWANDDFRKLVLNGIAWIAHVRIPKNGLESAPLTMEDIQRNLDPKPCNMGPKQ